MDSAKQQIVEKLTAANNILLTVSRDPSVDQLAACIALTVLLNKLDKHATAVFSGDVPSTIEFLKPDETLEKNTDSLRDFIIALDKSKADKLRYKVEDKVVKIFITPYKTSLSSDDLVFSQGDFNVDVVLALGVHAQVDLDDAITAHGRILHDATVMCINTKANGELGSINWVGQQASSLSEMATELAKAFEGKLLDEQIATALLTGIVAETDRFKNDKTTATTMSLSADLMKAGANQQLVADELEQALHLRTPQDDSDDTADRAKEEPKDGDETREGAGTLDIEHDEAAGEEQASELPEPIADVKAYENEVPDAIDFGRRTRLPDEPEEEDEEDKPSGDADFTRTLVTEPPTFGGTLTANSRPEDSGLNGVNMLPNEGTASPTPPMTLPTLSNPVTPLEETAEPEAAVETPDPQPASPAEPNPVTMPSPEPPQPPVMPDPPMPTTPQEPAFTPPAPTPGPPQAPAPVPEPTPAVAEPPKPETLTELEESVHSPHVDGPPTEEPAASSTEDIDKARDEVMRALNEQPSNLPPIEALNAQPVDLGKDAAESQPTTGQPPVTPLPVNPPEQAPFANSPADMPLDMPLPPSITLPPAQTQPPTNSPGNSPDSPPPVPPPFLPGNFGK